MKKGNIGYILNSDQAQLYRVDSVFSGLIYLRSLNDPLTFRTVTESGFWVILDSLE